MTSATYTTDSIIRIDFRIFIRNSLRRADNHVRLSSSFCATNPYSGLHYIILIDHSVIKYTNYVDANYVKSVIDGMINRLIEISYRKVSNIRRTLVYIKIVDHSDVVGASPVGAAPTTSSFST